MIYLASPYTHKDPHVVQERYDLTEQCTYELLKRGLPVFSPIVHCHKIAVDFGLPTDAAYWEKYNMEFLRRARELYILTIDGWQESKGMKQEIAAARGIRMPYHYVNEWGIEVLA